MYASIDICVYVIYTHTLHPACAKVFCKSATVRLLNSTKHFHHQ